jgi:hypothetical protein
MVPTKRSLSALSRQVREMSEPKELTAKPWYVYSFCATDSGARKSLDNAMNRSARWRFNDGPYFRRCAYLRRGVNADRHPTSMPASNWPTCMPVTCLCLLERTDPGVRKIGCQKQKSETNSDSDKHFDRFSFQFRRYWQRDRCGDTPAKSRVPTKRQYNRDCLASKW